MPVLLDPNRAVLATTLRYVEYGSKVEAILEPKDFAKWQRKNVPIKTLNVIWRAPTWQDECEIYTASCRVLKNPDGDVVERDPIVYRQLKIKKFIKKWDLVDENGKVVDITPDIIDQLHPAIASALLIQFLEVSEPLAKDLDDLERESVRFYDGKRKLVGEVSPYIYEHLLAKTYKWKLKDIRAMDYYDFLVHLRLCQIGDFKDKEFYMMSAGGGRGRKKKPDIPKDITDQIEAQESKGG